MGKLTLRGLNVTSCDQLKLQKKQLMHDLLTGKVRVKSAKPVKEDTSQLAALTTA